MSHANTWLVCCSDSHCNWQKSIEWAAIFALQKPSEYWTSPVFKSSQVFKWLKVFQFTNGPVFELLGCAITILMLRYRHSYLVPFEYWTLKSPVFRWLFTCAYLLANRWRFKCKNSFGEFHFFFESFYEIDSRGFASKVVNLPGLSNWPSIIFSKPNKYFMRLNSKWFFIKWTLQWITLESRFIPVVWGGVAYVKNSALLLSE